MELFGWERTSRSDPYYKACMVGAVAAGGLSGKIVGAMASVPTGGASFILVPAGLALGFVTGYMACPYLAPSIRQRVEAGMSLSEAEVRKAAESMGRYAQVRDASEAVTLLLIARRLAGDARGAQCTVNGAFAARQLLAAA
jgi:hypothetical protein